ncbi:type II polyketide synthase, acyl carrier protein [Nocardia nova SH22a]|uniref:Type II polyketide synthase, acyl carrier protein n=1 Tax=Nocardia nova SH22a TaxID=1415166 RepID=W5TF80_9NOCA|nr:acyl carrier protein [Nocardia nova]AHH15886.1 type II polyketide synthase, acyl carrier protein [Nocardia nova SH22a]
MTVQVSSKQLLATVLRQVAGDDDAIDAATLDAAGDETLFEDLGFDSIALLEVLNRLKREHGIALDDDVLEQALTPAQLVSAIDEELRDVA